MHIFEGDLEGEDEEEAGAAAAAGQGEDREFVSFHYAKPATLGHKEKVGIAKAATAKAAAEAALLSPAKLQALFREGGLDYFECDEAKRRKVLSYKPRKEGYCIYDGICYQKSPNFSRNADGTKRKPRCHDSTCLQEQSARIYEARFGMKRKRRRDGEG